MGGGVVRDADMGPGYRNRGGVGYVLARGRVYVLR